MKGRLKIELQAHDEPVIVDFNVVDPAKPITITITPTDVKVHTHDEPKVVTT